MKKNQKLLEMMNQLDETYIEEAEKKTFNQQKNIWKRAGAIAAGLVLAVSVCTFPIWGNFNNRELSDAFPTLATDADAYVWDAKEGVFKLYSVTLAENGNKVDSREDYLTNIPTQETEIATDDVSSPIAIGPGEGDDKKQTPNVLYPYIMGEYAAHGQIQKRLSPNYVGEKLGDVVMSGEDGKTLEAEMYAIVGIDPACAVAVKYPKYAAYCVFTNPLVPFETFSAFKTAYSLDTELYMGMIGVNYTVADQTERLNDLAEIAPLKAMILSLEGTACTHMDFIANCDMKKSVGMAVSHGSQLFLGGGLQIFADGYLVTNLGGSIQIFKIDENAAKDIIDHAKKSDYKGVHLYHEKRDIFVNRVGDDDVDIGVPETSGAYPSTMETATENPYGVMTPSYNPHETMPDQTDYPVETKTETSTAIPPYMPEFGPESTTEENPYSVNQPRYDGPDPYAFTIEETTRPSETTVPSPFDVNQPKHEGPDPYAS